MKRAFLSQSFEFQIFSYVLINVLLNTGLNVNCKRYVKVHIVRNPLSCSYEVFEFGSFTENNPFLCTLLLQKHCKNKAIFSLSGREPTHTLSHVQTTLPTPLAPPCVQEQV